MTRTAKKIRDVVLLLLLTPLSLDCGRNHHHSGLAPGERVDRRWQVVTSAPTPGVAVTWNLCFDLLSGEVSCICGTDSRVIDAPDRGPACAALTQTGPGTSTLSCLPGDGVLGMNASSGETVFGCC